MMQKQSDLTNGHIAAITATVTEEDAEHLGVGSLCAGIFKTFLAVPNNVAWVVMGNAIDTIRQSAAYQPKFSKLKALVKKATEEWKQYENALIYAQRNRLFDPRDLMDNCRQYYHEGMTSREYYEFWQGIGFVAYERTANHISALQHRYRKALIRGGEITNTEAAAAALTTHALFCLACATFDNIVEDCVSRFNVKKLSLIRSFRQLRLTRLADLWLLIARTIAPNFEVLPEEEDNVTLGLKDLCDLFLKSKNILHDEIRSIKEYSEVFADKKQQRKLIKNICHQKNQAS